jgi:hypothetical protein
MWQCHRSVMKKLWSSRNIEHSQCGNDNHISILSIPSIHLTMRTFWGLSPCGNLSNWSPGIWSVSTSRDFRSGFSRLKCSRIPLSIAQPLAAYQPWRKTTKGTLPTGISVCHWHRKIIYNAWHPCHVWLYFHGIWYRHSKGFLGGEHSGLPLWFQQSQVGQQLRRGNFWEDKEEIAF